MVNVSPGDCRKTGEMLLSCELRDLDDLKELIGMTESEVK
jgi:hypothetical protein